MKNFILIFLIVLPFSLLSQGEGNNWYFGRYAGITFNTNPPTVLNNGNLNTGEGCASVSDKNGNLVFYTDGRTVYDANHNIMPNGSGLFGNSSSTQSSVVCPKPGTYNYNLRRFDGYYIVTIEVCNGVSAGGNNGGVRYTEVDMTLNGGMGDVVTAYKNVHLFGTTTMEGANLAKHANGCDYWIIGKPVGNNQIYTYHISSSGVNTTPIINTTGPVIDIGWGSIKTTPNSKILGITVANNIVAPSNPQTHIYDFDNATGVVTHKYTTNNGGYSLEFSQNNDILYVSYLHDPNIYQYDLTTTSQTSFVASETIVGTTSANAHFYKVSGLQLASDGKIYVSLMLSNRLGAIENPNVLGIGCNYNDNAIAITGNNINGTAMQTTLGLPAFPSFFIFPNDIEYESANYSVNNFFCNSDSVTFKITDTNSVQSVNWFYSPVNSPYNNAPNSTTSEYTILPSTSGDYKVKAVVNYSCFIDTIIDTITVNSIPTINIPPNNVINCTENVLSLNAGLAVTGANFSHSWTTNTGNIISVPNNDSIWITKNGWYYLTTTDNLTSCSANDSVLVNIDTIYPTFYINEDTILTCSNMSINLGANNPTFGSFSYNWTTNMGNITSGQNTLVPQVNSTGIYYLTVTNNVNNCTNIDSLTVGIDTIHPTVQVNQDTLINCFVPQIYLSGNGSSMGDFSYLWTTQNGNIISGDASLTPQIDEPGSYILAVTNNFNGCTSLDSVNVVQDTSVFVEILFNNNNDSLYSIFSFEDNNFSYNGNSGTVNWSVNNNNYTSDSSFTYSFETSGENVVSIELLNSNNGCMAYDTVSFIVTHRLKIPSAISPNADGYNDEFLIRALENYDNNSLTIFNRWGEPVFEATPYENNWNGQTNTNNVLLGDKVSEGTYFYVLTLFENGEKIVYKGYLELKR